MRNVQYFTRGFGFFGVLGFVWILLGFSMILLGFQKALSGTLQGARWRQKVSSRARTGPQRAFPSSHRPARSLPELAQARKEPFRASHRPPSLIRDSEQRLTCWPKTRAAPPPTVVVSAVLCSRPTSAAMPKRRADYAESSEEEEHEDPEQRRRTTIYGKE